MPKIVLILPGGNSRECQFEVAPVLGSSIQLRSGGETHFYRVDDCWHAEAPGGETILYFANVVREDAPERWATAEAYLLPVGDTEVGLAPELPALEEGSA